MADRKWGPNASTRNGAQISSSQEKGEEASTYTAFSNISDFPRMITKCVNINVHFVKENHIEVLPTNAFLFGKMQMNNCTHV